MRNLDRQSQAPEDVCPVGLGLSHPEGRLAPAYTGRLHLSNMYRLKQKAAEEGLGVLRGSTESYCYGTHEACCYESISHHNYLICPFFKLDNKVECLTRPSLIQLHFLLSLAEEGSPSSIN